MKKILILLDGYNLLNKLQTGYCGNKQFSSEDLVNTLKTLSQNQTLIEFWIVFDGVKDNVYRQDQNLKIIFSPQNSTADQVIKNLFLQQREQFENVAVITSDKNLYNSLETMGCISIRSERFIPILNQDTNFSSIHQKEEIRLNYPNKRRNKVSLLNYLMKV